MDSKEKDAILSKAKGHLSMVCLNISKDFEDMKNSLQKAEANFRSLPDEDRAVAVKLMKYNEKRIGELNHLTGSPYFVRCNIIFDGEKAERNLYFGKFGFEKDFIYSWVTPASSIRFENPGNVQYKRPDGTLQKGNLLRKDNFMIVGGEIKFLSSETIDNPRELIYQDYFSKRKTGFALPEIVAQMEKAQDQVIRANHIGPFLISGPAGSGKTTLALHRVAYLIQSPDLSDLYTGNSIIVFVQDNGTKNYFSQLLPELGINDVLITTFSEWAFPILDIKENYVVRYGNSESDKDAYEFQKLRAIKDVGSIPYEKNYVFSLLEKAYGPYFNESQKKLFSRQKSERILDRIDLTLLLKLYYGTNGSLGVVKDCYIEQKNGLYKKVRKMVPFEYSLAVIDEFQNYLPEQLRIIKKCINDRSQSVIYVGDMAQQVQLGTIKNWDDIGEKIADERKVILQKVYRNTKNIIQYIKNLGYAIEISEGLKDGKEVAEYVFSNKDDELNYINKIINESGNLRFGILAKDPDYLIDFKKAFLDNDSVHIMTMNEAQGVEFDVVFLVGINKDLFAISEELPDILVQEKKRINKDLLYVALTRAISELHILGKEKPGKLV